MSCDTKITRGPWEAAIGHYGVNRTNQWTVKKHNFPEHPYEGDLENEWGVYPPLGESGPVALTAGEANARLIAEAGTVYSETGMTPQQLKSDRDRLAAELAEAKQQLAAKTSECDKQAVELAALREKAGKVVSTKQWYMQVRHAEQPIDNDAVNKAGEDFEYALVSLAAHLSTVKANDQSGQAAESEK